MIEIPLSRGYLAKVDDQDRHLAQFKWSASIKVRKSGEITVYAVREDPETHKMILMHRQIIGSTTLDIDHRNTDGTDNQRANLRTATRTATRTQNNANSRKRGGKSSRFKGVHWHAQCGRWTAQINKRHLGNFREEFDAALAYNFAAEEAYGEFARYNLP